MDLTLRRRGRRPVLGALAGAAGAAVLGCGRPGLRGPAGPGRDPHAAGEAPATVVVRWNEAALKAIRYLFRGRRVRAWGGPYQGSRPIDGGEWHPYQAATFVTPPFAEFVSGHSTFSAAAAEVLRRFTGSDAFGAATTIAPGSSHIEPGRTPAADVVLAWDTFTAAADEAGMSRRFGGIHFEDGDLAGRALGRAVGAAAWARASAHIDGTG